MMKTKDVLLIAPLVPLFIVIVLAVIGIMLNVWVYVVLAVVCPLAAGIIWFMYKDVEGKIKNAEKKSDRNKGA